MTSEETELVRKKKAGLPLTPHEEVLYKRQRNTEAARRSRQKKLVKVYYLETLVAQYQSQVAELKQKLDHVRDHCRCGIASSVVSK